MELLCDGRDKLEELHMKVMKWVTTGNFWELLSFREYRRNCDTKWFDKEMVCFLLREDVFQMLDGTDLKLEFICDRFSLSSAVNVQNALERLVDSMENQLNTKQWEKHRKLCELIEQVLRICDDRHESTTSQQVYARLLDYLMKLIDLCKDKKLIDSALSALRIFPYDKYQSELLKLVYSIENQFNSDQCQWRIQAKLCGFIREVLTLQSRTLDQHTSDQLLNYLTKLIDSCDAYETLNCAWNALIQFPGCHISSQVYQPLLQNYLQSSQLDWKMHQKWLTLTLLKCGRNETSMKCRYGIFYDIFKQIENIFGDNLWLEYLRKIIRQCDHMPLVLVAILLLETMYLKGYFNIESENIENIKNELMGHVQSLDSECVSELAHSLPDDFDFDRYQVEWCARWCVLNVMGRQIRWEMARKLPVIKLSNDRFEARSGQNFKHFIPIRTRFAVPSGVYFYEVTVVTSGKMKFGWSTVDTEFDEDYWRLHKFDMFQKFECNRVYIFVKQFDCQPGDVIGCLMDHRRFVFYCNGKKVVDGSGNGEMDDEEEDNEYYVDEQIINCSSFYYATALLSPNQHCYFNFGQVDFKFPPNHVQFMDFHKANVQNIRKYCLAETDIVNDHWFKHLPVGNKVDLFYRDKRQKECDELVKRVERDIEEGREVEEMKMELECDRYIQAIVEEMGKGQGGDKVDVVAQWVWKIMEKTIDKESDANLVELIYPYLHLRIASNIENKNQINSTLHCTKHRNICIVLSNLIKFSEQFDYYFIENIRKEVFTYLTRTLTETSDKWTQLFGLIALDYLKLSDHEKKMIKEDIKFIEILNENGRFNMEKINSHSPLSHQLHFTIEHFRTHVLDSPPPPRPNPAALNSHDRTSHLKLSLDLFSARSDWSWQSVRSTGRVTKGIYYFEAVLLTNGPMRIGWSTKRTEIVRTEVGGDEFSVAFDGYSRAVWHNAQQMQLEMSLERWKAHDVVGCLIRETRNIENNQKEKHFFFFLNGQLISYKAKSPIYSSPHPYHASISLSSHQQVFLNFGQTQFQHSPKVDYLTFTHYPQDVTNQKSLVNLNNSTFSNTLISIESTNNMGNLSMINHTISPEVENIHKSELTSKCTTCPQSLLTSFNPSNQNSLTKEHSNKQKLCEYDPALTSNSIKRLKVDRNAHDSQILASTSACENEDCKKKHAQLKLRITELETELKNKTKAEKCDKMMPSTSTFTVEHDDAQQENVVSIEQYNRLQQRCTELEKFVKELKRMLPNL